VVLRCGVGGGGGFYLGGCVGVGGVGHTRGRRWGGVDTENVITKAPLTN